MDGYMAYKKDQLNVASDGDILREKHQFIRNEKEDQVEGSNSWEVRMAMKYYRRLHKEYALVDLSRYKEEKIGLRWRTESEVVSGKGQFECGNITPQKKCDARDSLHSFEVNFKYVEAGQVKNELVKVRLCPHCARKLPNAKKVIKQSRQLSQESNIDEKSSFLQSHDSKKKDKKEKKDKKKKKRKRSRDSEEEVESEGVGEESPNTKQAKYSGGGGGGSSHSNSGGSAEDKEVNLWSHDAPKAKTEEDEMDSYLNSLFF
jgi:protein FRA10AC1